MEGVLTLGLRRLPEVWAKVVCGGKSEAFSVARTECSGRAKQGGLVRCIRRRWMCCSV